MQPQSEVDDHSTAPSGSSQTSGSSIAADTDRHLRFMAGANGQASSSKAQIRVREGRGGGEGGGWHDASLYGKGHVGLGLAKACLLK